MIPCWLIEELEKLEKEKQGHREFLYLDLPENIDIYDTEEEVQEDEIFIPLR